MADTENFSSSLQRPGRPGIQEIRDEFLGKFPFDAFSFDLPSATDPRLILHGYRLMVGMSSYGSKVSEQVGAGIIEVGSNSNGTWIKFSDGTMICYGRVEINTTMDLINANIGSYGWSFYVIYYSRNIVVNLPIEFLSADSYQFILNENGGLITFPYHQRATKSQVRVGYASYAPASTMFDWIAIGRWK